MTSIEVRQLAAILGTVAGKSALDVYGELTRGPERDTDSLLRALRPALIAEYERKLGKRTIYRPGRVEHPAGLPLACDVDAVVPEGTGLATAAICELVTWEEARGWAADLLPARIRAIAQAAMEVLQCPVFDVIALILDDSPRITIFREARDTDAGAALAREAHAFHVEHMIAGVPPAPRGIGDGNRFALKAFPEPQDERWIQDDSEECRAEMRAYRAASDAVRLARADADVAEFALLMRIGDAPGLRSESGVVTWTAPKKGGRRRVSTRWFDHREASPAGLFPDTRSLDGPVTAIPQDREWRMRDITAAIKARNVDEDAIARDIVEPFCAAARVHSMVQLDDVDFTRLERLILDAI